MMQAIEFTTTITNGMIKIPKIKEFPLPQEVKVIVLFDSVPEAIQSENPDQNFRAVRIKTKGFK
jgi:hypothetical protein